MPVSFDRVQWLDASRQGIPFDSLDPTSDIPSEFSRRASIFDDSLGIPDSGARDRLSNPFRRVSLRPLEAFVDAYLGLQGKEEAVAVRLFARWARPFRREPLRHGIGAEFGAPRL